MMEKLKNVFVRLVHAFGSPFNTLLAQAIIVSLLLMIGGVAASRAQQNAGNLLAPLAATVDWKD